MIILEKVTVVIPCYNQGIYLRDAIMSVMKSTYRDIEVIIVNDGSTDAATIQELHRIERELMPNVHVIHQENRGLPAARNAGIVNATGSMIVPLDADDMIDPSFIEKTVWCYTQGDNIGLVFTDVKIFGNEDYIWKVPNFSKSALFEENIIASCALFPKHVWHTLGGYDESYTQGYEDWEFWIRIADAGHEVKQIREPLFFYRKHGTSMISDSQRRHADLVRKIRRRHPTTRVTRLHWRSTLKRAYTLIKPLLPVDVSKTIKKVYYTTTMRNTKTLPTPKATLFDKLAHDFRRSQVCMNLTESVMTNSNYINIMYVLPSLNIGGVESLYLLLIKRLPEHIRPIIVTTESGQGAWVDKFKEACPFVYNLPSIGDDLTCQINFLIDLILNHEISIVQICNSEVCYHALPLVKEYVPDVKILDYIHMRLPMEPWDFATISAHYDQYIHRHVYITPSLRADCMRLFNLHTEKCLVIPNALDSYASLPPEELRTFDVGFIGRLELQKRPITFLRVCLGVHFRVRDGETLRFFIAGTGPMLLRIKILVWFMKLMRVNIILYEPPFDSAYLLSQLKVLVAPSIREGLPIIGLEAMGNGAVVVASKVPGWTDLIEDNVNGVLITDGVRSFIIAVQRLIFDSGVQEELATNALEKIEKYHDPEKYSASFVELYEEANMM